MKRIISLILAVFTLAAFTACSTDKSASSSAGSSSSASSKAAKSYEVNLAALAGPTGMGMAFMLDSSINQY